MNVINTPINNQLIKKESIDFKNNSNPIDLQKNFLSLLIAQIKNQDPTDPIKNTELTSQLAQINTASGIEKLNNTVGNFSSQINKNQNIQVSSLIGHRVMILNNQITHTQNLKTRFGIELINNATLVQIKIIDDKGKIIHSRTIKNIPSGTHSFLWDGKDLNNNPMPTGKYNLSVVAKNKDKNVPVQSLSEAFVNSIITSSSDDPIIDLGGAGTTTLSNIREILQ